MAKAVKGSRTAKKKTTTKTPVRRPGVKRAKAPARREPAARRWIELRVNGRVHALEVGRDLQPSTTLAVLLRERLGFTGLKIACDEGACGGCTVLLDGQAVLSCMLLAVEAHGHEIVTVEGLPADDPVIQAFAEQSEPGHGTALQCGYCTPGFVMTARALLDENPAPSLAEVKEALGGNICRCGCYQGIAQAVLHAAEKLAARRAQGVKS
ncbi:MAG TPA: (2Fe-2S)-binding protein [Myxococcota bacterium]|nr:(2Fe-2S)-binding protein [Myxococcota bacterium]HRY93265.1 (2Fe-2S)-binding protein [Myxococcota bacterium]HSA19953.1 (2Fe-2S)-binding protein [Myxococcota bacterium]